MYGEVKEFLTNDEQAPLGNYLRLTYYVDANLFHDQLNGHSFTGMIIFFNKTPVDWYYKKQNTVETTVYVPGFVSVCTCVENIIDLRNTLRFLGVLIRQKSYMSGDKNMLLTVTATRMPSYINTRLIYPFMESGSILYLRWLNFTMSMG